MLELGCLLDCVSDEGDVERITQPSSYEQMSKASRLKNEARKKKVQGLALWLLI